MGAAAGNCVMRVFNDRAAVGDVGAISDLVGRGIGDLLPLWILAQPIG